MNISPDKLTLSIGMKATLSTQQPMAVRAYVSVVVSFSPNSFNPDLVSPALASAWSMAPPWSAACPGARRKSKAGGQAANTRPMA